MELFERAAGRDPRLSPLADRMRPQSVKELVGQRHLLEGDQLLGRLLRSDRIPSMILWGPPGTGKTTIAHVVAAESKGRFASLSAVLGGVVELRQIIKVASEHRALRSERTVLFVDEIHRFNKAQQDALLPHVEKGTVILIGATTENPSFAVNSALLSRTRVFRLEPLSSDDIELVLDRAVADPERGLGNAGVTLTVEARKAVAASSRGDARRALNALELIFEHATAKEPNGPWRLDVDAVEQAMGAVALRYDKSGEEHYNVVSAFIKSMRGNDPDAAIYWMMRMVDAGEDPLFVLRRLLIFASEDIGNADPRALELAIASDAAFRRLGMPEGLFAMAQCCTYLASAPKSNASYQAFTRAREDIEAFGALPVPLRLRNAATGAMKAWGYGEGYRYPHDEGGHAAGETYLPDELDGRTYYRPLSVGFEARIGERLAGLRRGGSTEDDPNT